MSENAAPAATEITTEDLGEIIRIVDPELDVQAILEEIRTNLRSRPPLDPDPSALTYRPADGADLGAQGGLEWLIDMASDSRRELAIGEQMRPASGPVGQLLNRARRPLHQLSRFYVELLARKVAEMDDHVVRALGILATRSRRSEAELAALRQEVAALRREIATLSATPPAS